MLTAAKIAKSDVVTIGRIGFLPEVEWRVSIFAPFDGTSPEKRLLGVASRFARFESEAVNPDAIALRR
jgi:hypothetical protein